MKIPTIEFLIAARCSGSIESLAKRLNLDIHTVYQRLIVLKRRGIVVRFRSR
ncbi:MAG TPA: hypothetical protein PKE45_20895 [Caldilineaceae bacterium]|nr:hypothetical protein [Caldilineaceae bacterium]